MSPQTSSIQTNYFHRLDAIRGVAILWVVLFHFCGAVCGWNTLEWERIDAGSWWWLSVPRAMLGRVLAMGDLGVPMFFVLSGFLIHYTYCRSPDQRVSVFWFRRWGRIVPPYLVALAAFTIFGGAILTARGRTDVWMHLLLIHNFHDRTFFGINPSFWSLAHEAQFYMLYPLLLRVWRGVGALPVVCGALLVRLGIGIWAQMDPEDLAADPATARMLPRMYFEWILGMYVADCIVKGKRALPWGWIAGGLCMVYAFAAYHAPWWELGVVPAVAVATAIWVDQIVTQRQPGTWLERMLIPLGVISYSVYLWHQPIVNHLSSHIIKTFAAVPMLGSSGAIALALVLCCLASVVVGAGAYQLFEIPAMAWVKRCSKRSEPRESSIVSPMTGASNSPRAGLRLDGSEIAPIPPPIGGRVGATMILVPDDRANNSRV